MRLSQQEKAIFDIVAANEGIGSTDLRELCKGKVGLTEGSLGGTISRMGIERKLVRVRNRAYNGHNAATPNKYRLFTRVPAGTTNEDLKPWEFLKRAARSRKRHAKNEKQNYKPKIQAPQAPKNITLYYRNGDEAIRLDGTEARHIYQQLHALFA